MKHYSRLTFCIILISNTVCHTSQNENRRAKQDEIFQIFAMYYKTQIIPFHDAARKAVLEFNQQYPLEKLQEQPSNKLNKVLFKSLEKNWLLKINPQTNIGLCSVQLKKPNHKDTEQLVEQNPERLYQTILTILTAQT